MANTHSRTALGHVADRADDHGRKMVEVKKMHRISVGDDIEALLDGAIQHQGRVMDVLPEMGLFWIFDQKTLQRRLIELDEFTILVPENTEAVATLEVHP